MKKNLLPKQLSTLRNFQTAITMRFATLSCKTHKYYAAAAAGNLGAAIPQWSAETEFAKRKGITHNSYANCSSKTGSRRPSGKTTILRHFSKGILEGNPSWYSQQPQHLIFTNLSENTSARFPWIKWTWPGLASATFSRTRWTWLGFAPRLPSPEPSPEPCWTWPGSAPKPPRLLRICWTWLGSAPEPVGTFSGTFSRTRWTWLGFAPRLPVTFSGTFSRTVPNLNLPALHQSLQDLLREPFPEPCWTWPGCTKASQTFPGTFSGTLLLCTKASWNLLWNPLNLVHAGATLGWRPHYIA